MTANCIRASQAIPHSQYYYITVLLLCARATRIVTVASIREQPLFLSAHLEVRLLFESGNWSRAASDRANMVGALAIWTALNPYVMQWAACLYQTEAFVFFLVIVCREHSPFVTPCAHEFYSSLITLTHPHMWVWSISCWFCNRRMHLKTCI